MTAQPTPPAERDAGEAVLAVRDLSIGTGSTRLLHDVSFRIHRGERVGLIGESGSGKSLTALAVMGLLGDGLRAAGSVVLAGHDANLLTASERRLSRVRGNDMAMVFQEPMTALNPTMRVGRQVAEVMTLHRTASGAGARQRAVQLLDQVGLPDPGHIARSYPHQLSGGQRQRVVTAIALANDPLLLVCDEPTTALDVTVQALVLDLLVRGVEARKAAMLFITHDLAVVASTCERVLVMYGGRIVEAGPVAEVFAHPRHRYTQGLLAASDLERPASAADGERVALPTIRGSVPPAGKFPEGCVFRNRCEHADDACAALPPWTARDGAAGAATPRDGAAGAATPRDGVAETADAARAVDAGYACFHPAADDDEVVAS